MRTNQKSTRWLPDTVFLAPVAGDLIYLRLIMNVQMTQHLYEFFKLRPVRPNLYHDLDES